MSVHGDVTLDMDVMRGQLHAAESTRAAADIAMRRELYSHGDALTFAEFEQHKKEIKGPHVLEVRYLEEVEGLRGVVDAHTETPARLENRVKAGDAEWLAYQLLRGRAPFAAQVYSTMPTGPPVRRITPPYGFSQWGQTPIAALGPPNGGGV
ncbi:hypothetical protein ON010_g347 [Phytophthora cinnamomi]|nr:hypothetical protein ON010_g347 [Phytophthora cinnamomi]